MLENIFKTLAATHCNSSHTIQQEWQKIELAYTQKERYYHTLEHLIHIHTQLQQVQPKISDWSVLLATLFYHDVVYEVQQKKQ